MMVILGLILVVAAVIVGVVGIQNNDGSAHALSGDFTVLGYHVTGSTATVYLSGLIVGAVGMAGLALLLAGLRRNTSRIGAARTERDLARREADSARRGRGDVVAGARPAVPVTRTPTEKTGHGWHLFGGHRAGHTS